MGSFLNSDFGIKKTVLSTHRQRSSHGVNKSSSDTELAQGKGKGRKSRSKEKWPLLEGLTVDELARYRRRRVQGQPRDNLRLYPELDDKVSVSEYRETFRANEDSIKVGIRNKTVYFYLITSSSFISGNSIRS